MANCKPITCYGKEYKSCKSLSADFGFNDNQYWKFVSQLRKGLKPETIVEDILDDINIKNAKTIEHNNVKEEQKVTISGDLKGTVVNKIFKDREELKHEVIQEVVEDEIEEHHNDTTIMVSPEYYTAKSPTELLELIDNFNPSKINIIDFENVVGKIDVKEINKEDTVNIFVYNATIYSNNFFKTILEIKVPNIQILTHTVGDIKSENEKGYIRILKDPEDTGRELSSYLSSRPRVPSGIDEFGTNNIVEWINKL